MRIGDGARIGVNAVIMSDVPAGATMVGVAARMIGPRPVRQEPCFPAYGCEPGQPDDPVARVIERLERQVAELSARLDELEPERIAARRPDRAAG